VRIVLDTNVLIGALITKGTPPDALVQAWREKRFQLVTSDEQLSEFEDVYRRARLRKFLSLEDAVALHNTMVDVAEFVSDLPEIHASKDPDDNLILATAVAGAADLVVTGDGKDLLVLEDFEGVPIVTPREAVTRLADE